MDKNLELKMENVKTELMHFSFYILHL